MLHFQATSVRASPLIYCIRLKDFFMHKVSHIELIIHQFGMIGARPCEAPKKKQQATKKKQQHRLWRLANICMCVCVWIMKGKIHLRVPLQHQQLHHDLLGRHICLLIFHFSKNFRCLIKPRRRWCWCTTGRRCRCRQRQRHQQQYRM